MFFFSHYVSSSDFKIYTQLKLHKIINKNCILSKYNHYTKNHGKVDQLLHNNDIFCQLNTNH